MKVADLLETRRENWRELEQLCTLLEGPSRRKAPAPAIARFSVLYRTACADLALADAYQLPPSTVHYLHQLVGRAHNQLYRTRTFDMTTWLHELFVRVPRRLFGDNCLRLAFVVFWGVFLLSAITAYHSPEFAERVMGASMMGQLEENFSEPITGRRADIGGGMAGFYVYNNTGIGLRCFAFGLLFGIGGLYVTVFNAAAIGAAFGHMGTVPEPQHFFHFVTAHGPFELTAVVLSAAAGMRLGFSLVDTRGYTRTASLRRAADETMPTMGAAMVMFFLAALIEGFLSPSGAPYSLKAAVAVLSAGMLMFYFVILGYPREE
ncbi:MAG: stage II sporulation protein M [Pirellulales bacterium]|nr:stage II sporulation protein M [Pirellulales bacterium]